MERDVFSLSVSQTRQKQNSTHCSSLNTAAWEVIEQMWAPAAGTACLPPAGEHWSLWIASGVPAFQQAVISSCTKTEHSYPEQPSKDHCETLKQSYCFSPGISEHSDIANLSGGSRYSSPHKTRAITICSLKKFSFKSSDLFASICNPCMPQGTTNFLPRASPSTV